MVDISNPAAPTEIAIFDPFDDTNIWQGNWGVYPHTPSRQIYASARDGTLSVLELAEALPNDFDTLRLADVYSAPGNGVRLDVYVHNSAPAYQFELPIDWNGPYDLQLDSLSTFGLRTDHSGGHDAADQVVSQL